MVSCRHNSTLQNEPFLTNAKALNILRKYIKFKVASMLKFTFHFRTQKIIIDRNFGRLRSLSTFPSFKILENKVWEKLPSSWDNCLLSKYWLNFINLCDGVKMRFDFYFNFFLSHVIVLVCWISEKFFLAFFLGVFKTVMPCILKWNELSRDLIHKSCPIDFNIIIRQHLELFIVCHLLQWEFIEQKF